MIRISAVSVLVLALAVPAAAQMPDVSQMSGMPLPTGDLPNGSVSVRVVRGDLSNDVVGVEVELHGGPYSLKVKTDKDGRALFQNLPPGTSVHAFTVVDGQRIESQEFAIPASGGIRTILVARASGSGAAAPAGEGGATAPGGMPPPQARPGTMVIGGQSRVAFELADDALDVYYLLDLVNASNAPVTSEPVIFELPDGARGASTLEGSSPQAKAEGRRVEVTGPFAPGVTSVQFAYQLPYSGGDVQVTQRVPLALSSVSLAVRKVGDMRMSFAQAATQHEMTADNRRLYMVSTGRPVPAGGTLDLTITGLPYHAPWPRYLALALAALIAAGGAWFAMGDERSETESRQKKLDARREQLLNELVRLEEQRLAGRGDARSHERRRDALVAQLEQVYGQLENAGTVLNAGTAPGAARARASA